MSTRAGLLAAGPAAEYRLITADDAQKEYYTCPGLHDSSLLGDVERTSFMQTVTHYRCDPLFQRPRPTHYTRDAAACKATRANLDGVGAFIAENAVRIAAAEATPGPSPAFRALTGLSGAAEGDLWRRYILDFLVQRLQRLPDAVTSPELRRLIKDPRLILELRLPRIDERRRAEICRLWPRAADCGAAIELLAAIIGVEVDLLEVLIPFAPAAAWDNAETYDFLVHHVINQMNKTAGPGDAQVPAPRLLALRHSPDPHSAAYINRAFYILYNKRPPPTPFVVTPLPEIDLFMYWDDYQVFGVVEKDSAMPPAYRIIADFDCAYRALTRKHVLALLIENVPEMAPLYRAHQAGSFQASEAVVLCAASVHAFCATTPPPPLPVYYCWCGQVVSAVNMFQHDKQDARHKAKAVAEQDYGGVPVPRYWLTSDIEAGVNARQYWVEPLRLQKLGVAGRARETKQLAALADATRRTAIEDAPPAVTRRRVVATGIGAGRGGGGVGLGNENRDTATKRRMETADYLAAAFAAAPAPALYDEEMEAALATAAGKTGV